MFRKYYWKTIDWINNCTIEDTRLRTYERIRESRISVNFEALKKPISLVGPSCLLPKGTKAKITLQSTDNFFRAKIIKNKKIKETELHVKEKDDGRQYIYGGHGKVIKLVVGNTAQDNTIISKSNGLLIETYNIDKKLPAKKGDLIEFGPVTYFGKIFYDSSSEIGWANDCDIIANEAYDDVPSGAVIKFGSVEQPVWIEEPRGCDVPAKVHAKISLVSYWAAPQNLSIINNPNDQKETIALHEEDFKPYAHTRIAIQEIIGKVIQVIENVGKGNLVIVESKKIKVLALDENKKKAKIGDWVKIKNLEIWKIYLKKEDYKKIDNPAPIIEILESKNVPGLKDVSKK